MDRGRTEMRKQEEEKSKWERNKRSFIAEPSWQLGRDKEGEKRGKKIG